MGRVVLMKNEHDLSRDFPHTHWIRLPAQESHKQGNQNCCCESKKRVSLQSLHQSRALLLRKMAAAPSCAQPAAPGLCARSKVSTSTCSKWCCRPCRSAAPQPPWDPRPNTCPAAQARTRCLPAPRIKSQTKPVPYCLRAAQHLADLRPAPNK